MSLGIMWTSYFIPTSSLHPVPASSQLGSLDKVYHRLSLSVILSLFIPLSLYLFPLCFFLCSISPSLLPFPFFPPSSLPPFPCFYFSSLSPSLTFFLIYSTHPPLLFPPFFPHSFIFNTHGQVTVGLQGPSSIPV